MDRQRQKALEEYQQAGWKIEENFVAFPSGNIYDKEYLIANLCPICDWLIDCGSQEEICFHNEETER